MSRFLKDLDRKVSILGIVLSLALMAFVMAVKPRPIYLLPAVAILATCAIWLWRGRGMKIGRPRLSPAWASMLLASAFFFLFALSVLVVYERADTYERPDVYFVLTSLMAGVVALQCLRARGRQVPLVLLQVFILGVSLVWSQLLIFPNSLAGIDPWWHQNVTNQLVETHSIPDTPYYSLPFFHLLVGSTSILLQVDYKAAVMLSASLAQIIVCSLVVYVLGSYIFKDPRVGLLAALILTISDNQVSFGFWTVPTSLAAVFVTVAVLVLLKTRRRHPVIGLGLIAFMMFATTLTNSVTSLFLVLVLMAGYGASLLYQIREKVRTTDVTVVVPTMSIVIVLAWWGYASGYMAKLRELISWGLSMDYYVRDTSYVTLGYASNVPFFDQVLDNFGLLVLFSISIFGVLYMLSRRDDFTYPAMALMGMTPLAVGFLSLMIGGAALEQRWWYYAQIMLAGAAAVALVLCVGKRDRTGLRTAVIAVAICAVCFVSILSPIADMDNRTLSESLGTRYAMTDSEMQTLEASSTIWDGRLYADGYYDSVGSSLSHSTKSLDDGLYQESFVNESGGMVMLRSEVMHHTFALYGQQYRLDYDPRFVLQNEGFSEVYTTGSTLEYLMT